MYTCIHVFMYTCIHGIHIQMYIQMYTCIYVPHQRLDGVEEQQHSAHWIQIVVSQDYLPKNKKIRLIGVDKQHYYDVIIIKKIQEKHNGMALRSSSTKIVVTPGLLACCRIFVILFYFFYFLYFTSMEPRSSYPRILASCRLFFFTFLFFICYSIFFQNKSTCLLPRRACHSFFQISNDVSERICLKNIFVSMPTCNFCFLKSQCANVSTM